MTLPPVPQSGRRAADLKPKTQEALLRQPHPLDLRDPFANDPDPEVRLLGRLSVRRDEIDDDFALGDLCAQLSLVDGRLRVVYVGKALIAYQRAERRAHDQIDRTMARRAWTQFGRWIAEAALAYPTRRNLSVALWAISEDEETGTLMRGLLAAYSAALPETSSGGATPFDGTQMAERTGYTESLPSLPSTPTDKEKRVQPDRVRTQPMTPVAETTYLSGEFNSAVLDVPPLATPEQGDGFTRADLEVVAGEASALDVSVGKMVEPEPLLPLPSQQPDMQMTVGDESISVDVARYESLVDMSADLSAEDAVNGAAPPPRPADHATQFEQPVQPQYESIVDAGEDVLLPGKRPTLPALLGDSSDEEDGAARARDEFNIGQKMMGRYEVVNVKRGGMGVVYLCYDAVDREPVAIKSFQSRFLENPRAVARFEQEALTWIRLEKHRHIVGARLVETIAGKPHLLLEHISGPEGLDADLRSWIEHKRLTPPLAVEFGLHIALGMQHATERVPGLVHRDLKPANILVTHDSIAKVTDFGLVRSVDDDDAPLFDLDMESDVHSTERLTRAGAVIGTAPYLSPEQCLALPVDTRSDIYAFGCLLYEMLTGRHIFDAHKFEAWLHAHVYELPEFDPLAAAVLPPDLIALVLACINKAPEDRPQTWGEIVETLANVYQAMTGQAALMETSGPALIARELMDKGYSLTELGRYEEAVTAYDRAILLQPDYAWAWARKGRTLRLLRRYELSLAAYDEALRLFPRYAWAWKGKGIVLERLKLPEQALVCYRNAAALDPDDPWSWTNQADILTSFGLYSEALVNLERALGADPNHPNSWAKRGQIYRIQGQYEESVTAYRRAIDLLPTYAWAHNGCGLAYKALGHTEESLLAFKRACRYEPDVVWHWFNLAGALIDLRRYDEALVPAQQATRTDPTHPSSWARLGQVLRYLSRYEDAYDAYTRATALDPQFSWAITGSAIALEHMGRLEEALAAHQQAAALAPHDVWNWYNLGNVYALREEYQAALDALEQALRLGPDHARSWARLGHVQRIVGRLGDAAASLERATALDPALGWAWSELGIVHERAEQLDAAHTAFGRAAALAPNDAAALVAQAEVLVKLNRMEEATPILRRAVMLEPTHARAWATLGQTLRRTHQPNDALTAYTRALELDPSYAWAWNGRGLALSALGIGKDALRAFQKAVELDSSNAQYIYNHVAGLLEEEQPDAAIVGLQVALATHATDADLWALLGKAYRQDEQPDKAVTAYEQALALNPTLAWAWNGHGLALEALGRRGAAITSFERAVAITPTYVWYHTLLIDTLLEDGRKRDALTAAQQMTQTLPRADVAWERYGRTQRHLNDYAGAIASYTHALELARHNGRVWNGLGLAYQSLNRPFDAVDAFAEAVACSPEDVWFWRNYGDACLQIDDCTHAVQAFNRALLIVPDDALTLRKLEAARNCADEDAPPP